MGRVHCEFSSRVSEAQRFHLSFCYLLASRSITSTRRNSANRGRWLHELCAHCLPADPQVGGSGRRKVLKLPSRRWTGTQCSAQGCTRRLLSLYFPDFWQKNTADSVARFGK